MTLSVVFTIAQGMANLVAIIYLARVFGPRAYGVFTYTWVVTGVLGIVAYLGLPAYLTRQISQNPQKALDIASTGLTITMILSGGSALVFLGVVQLIPGLHHYDSLFSLWTLLFLPLGMNPRWVYSAIGRLWIATLMEVVAAVIRMTLLIWWVHSPRELTLAVAITVGVYLGAAALGWIWLRRFVRVRFQYVNLRQAVNTIILSLPLSITSTVRVLYAGTDVWILQMFQGATAVGHYSAAYRPITFLLTLSTVYFQMAFPVASRLTAQSSHIMKQFLAVSVVAIAALALPAAIGADIVALPVMTAAFGLSYASSGVVFAILVWSWAVSLLREVYYTALLAQHKERTFLRYFAITTVFNVVLMSLLVRWGALGTATALLVTQTVLLLMSAYGVQKTVDRHPRIAWVWKSLMKISVNTAIMAISVWILKPYVIVWVAVLIGCIVYAILTLTIRPLSRGQLSVFNTHTHVGTSS